MGRWTTLVATGRGAALTSPITFDADDRRLSTTLGATTDLQGLDNVRGAKASECAVPGEDANVGLRFTRSRCPVTQGRRNTPQDCQQAGLGKYWGAARCEGVLAST